MISQRLISSLAVGFSALLVTATANASWDNKVRAFATVPSNQTSLCSEGFFESIRNLRSLGADRFSFVIAYSQQTLTSSEIFSYSRTPTDESLVCGINYVLSQGMDFGLNLVINVPGWRANIDPVDRDLWFQQMGAIATKYARDFAEPYGAKHMSVGTEMYKLISHTYDPRNASTPENYRWPDIIEDVRNEFSGQIMYSAQHSGNRSAIFETNDLIENVDVLGFSGYWPLYAAPNKASLLEEWSRIEQLNILPAIERYGKQIVLSEIGYRPCSFALIRPYDSDEPCAYDPQTQSLAWDAVLTFFEDKTYFDGLIGGWAWEDDPTLGGVGDTRYTPWAKPAALTIASIWPTSTLTEQTNILNDGSTNGSTDEQDDGLTTITSSSSGGIFDSFGLGMLLVMLLTKILPSVRRIKTI